MKQRTNTNVGQESRWNCDINNKFRIHDAQIRRRGGREGNKSLININNVTYFRNIIRQKWMPGIVCSWCPGSVSGGTLVSVSRVAVSNQSAQHKTCPDLVRSHPPAGRQTRRDRATPAMRAFPKKPPAGLSWCSSACSANVMPSESFFFPPPCKSRWSHLLQGRKMEGLTISPTPAQNSNTPCHANTKSKLFERDLVFPGWALKYHASRSTRMLFVLYLFIRCCMQGKYWHKC